MRIDEITRRDLLKGLAGAGGLYGLSKLKIDPKKDEPNEKEKKSKPSFERYQDPTTKDVYYRIYDVTRTTSLQITPSDGKVLLSTKWPLVMDPTVPYMVTGMNDQAMVRLYKVGPKLYSFANNDDLYRKIITTDGMLGLRLSYAITGQTISHYFGLEPGVYSKELRNDLEAAENQRIEQERTTKEKAKKRKKEEAEAWVANTNKYKESIRFQHDWAAKWKKQNAGRPAKYAVYIPNNDPQDLSLGYVNSNRFGEYISGIEYETLKSDGSRSTFDWGLRTFDSKSIATDVANANAGIKNKDGVPVIPQVIEIYK
jgi:hypothetical protein